MPAIANITVADATPANHILEPRRAGVDLAAWATDETVTLDGNIRLAATFSAPSKARKTSKGRIVLTVPVEAVVDGITQVVRTRIYTIEAVVDKDCTNAEANHGFVMARNLLSNQQIIDLLGGRKPVY